MSRPRLAIVGILILALGVRLYLGTHLRDDAYITFRYAQHLATGLGFTFDTGQRVLGTTTPLFTILLAAFSQLGVPPDRAAPVVGVGSDLIVIALLYEFTQHTVDRRVALLAALTYAVLSPTASYAVSGMETPLYLLLILLSFELARRDRQVWCAVSCGLLALLRPDGLLVPASLVLVSTVRTVRSSWTPVYRQNFATMWLAALPRSWLPLLVFGSIVAPWIAASWWYFGSPIPHSLIAKWELPVGRLASMRYFYEYFLDTTERWFLPLTAVAAIGLLSWRRIRPTAWPILAWGWLYVVAFLGAQKFVYPQWPFEWYYLPVLLLYSITIGLGLSAILRLVSNLAEPRPWLKRLAGGVVLGLFLMANLYQLTTVHDRLDLIVGGRETLYGTLVARLSSYGVAQDMVAAPEIGAFGYAYPGPLLDLDGLISPEVVGRTRQQVLTSAQPPWIASYNTLIPPEVRESAWFKEHYRPVFALTNWESRQLILYRWYPAAIRRWAAGPVLGDSIEMIDRTLTIDDSPLGRFLRVELTWLPTTTIGSPLTFSVRARSAGGSTLAQQDNEPQEGTRPTLTWRPGVPIVDRFDLRLPDVPGPDPATLEVIAYPTGHAAATLPWRTSDGNGLGQVLTVPLSPPDTKVQQTPPTQPCRIGFARGLHLTDYAIVPGPAGIEVQLQWGAGQPPARDYTVFVHAIDRSGATIAQADGPPVGGRIPTSTWLPGDQITDVHVIGSVTTDQVARIELGWYFPSTGERLERTDGAGDTVTIRGGVRPGCS